MNRYVLNVAPLNSTATYFCSGSSAMTLGATGNAKKATTASGTAQIKVAAAGARLTVRLKAAGSSTLRLQAAAGNLKTAKRGQGSVSVSLTVSRAGRLQLGPGGASALQLNSQGDAIVRGPVRLSARTKLALQSELANLTRHRPRFGAGRSDVRVATHGQAILLATTNPGGVSLALATRGSARVGTQVMLAGEASKRLTLQGTARIMQLVTLAGQMGIAITLQPALLRQLTKATSSQLPQYTTAERVMVMPREDRSLGMLNEQRLFYLENDSRTLIATEGNSMLGTFNKSAADKLDYTIDCTRWLGGDIISAATASVTPADGLAIQQVQHNDCRVTAWLDGGTLGQTYTINITITTLAGRQKSECFGIRIR